MSRGGRHMRPRRAPRILVDVGLALVLTLVMATAIIEDVAHEWLGIAAFALVVAHQVLNRAWWHALLRGRYTARRVAGVVVNLALVGCVLALMASSVVISAHAFFWLPAIPGSFWARMTHLLCSFWSFVLAGVHVGMHIGPVLARAYRRNVASRLAASAACALSLVAGLASFQALDVATYLVLGSPFMFVDGSVPLAVRVLQWLAVGALFVVVGAGIWEALGRIARKGHTGA